MEYLAGLDVSLRSCAICAVDAKGKESALARRLIPLLERAEKRLLQL
jgi:hypothetical protein